jgi:peptidoglycan/LPS O-acetylase OafA/YrhL
VSIISAQPSCVRQPPGRSKWHCFSFPPCFVLTYFFLLLRVWDSLIDNELKTRGPRPEVPEGVGVPIIAIEMRAILILALFVLCLPFLPPVRKWEAAVVGALAAVFTSALDFQFWRFGLNRLDGLEFWLAAIGFPALSTGLAILLLRYVEKRLRQ